VPADDTPAHLEPAPEARGLLATLHGLGLSVRGKHAAKWPAKTAAS
jgi:hypothetical protein